MPFANLSGDPEQEFLADGLTEDIILGLSRVKQLFVIARNTSFTYKGRTLDAALVSRELGVRYVLEGSVRRSGDRIRVSAQLVDARTRRPTWSEQFDRQVEEILNVDDEVTEAIVAALHPALRRAEAELARRAAPEDLTAWALVNRAWVTVQSDLGDTGAAQEAIRACEDALARDPDYAFAHAVLAHAKSLLFHQPVPEDRRAEALASIQRALELGPDDPLVEHCHAAVMGNLGRTEEGVRAWVRAIELDPNNAGAHAGLGIAKIFMRRADESLPLIDGALRRSPADPLVYHWLGNRAFVLLLTGRPSEAIDAARASLDRRPSRLAYAVLAAALAHEGRLEEAAEAYAELERRIPGLVAERFAHLAASLAPDGEWGVVVGRAVCAAAEAKADASARVAADEQRP
jgi:adenylate cyclase